MLRRHSNPTKNKVWWPRQTRLLVGFGLRFFYKFLLVFMSFYRCSTVFLGLWRSCFIKNLVLLTKTVFLQKLVQNQVLIPRPAFFRDLVDTGYRYYIYIYTYIHIFNIYIEFRCFGGICCGGILTVRKTKVWWPRHNREANLIKQFLNIFIHIYQHNTDWKVEFW